MKIIFALTLLPLCSSAQTATISGNAFYHYNEYVGDRADAGDDVYLIREHDTASRPASTQTDVAGNFKFEKLEPGRYILVVVSKNTFDNGNFNFIGFNGLKGVLTDFIGVDIDCNEASYDSVKLMIDRYSQVTSKKMSTWHAGRDLKNMEAARDAAAAQERRTLSIMAAKIPVFIMRPFVGLTSGGLTYKIDIEAIDLSADQNKTVITNFGVSYL